MVKKISFNGYTSGRQRINKHVPDLLGHCTVHDKSTWSSRKAARKALKNRHPGEIKSPYRCDYTNGWHYGALNRTRDNYRGIENGEENDGGDMDAGLDEQQQPGELA